MKTKRLYLRERVEEELQRLLDKPQDQQFKFFGIADSGELEKQLSYIRKGLSNYRTSFKMWDMVRLSDEQVIGALGYHSWFIPHKRAEIGYQVHEPYRKQGFMKEALLPVIEYGFSEMNLNRIEALVGPDNEWSLKLVNALGFEREGYLREHYFDGERIQDSLFYALLKKDFYERRGS